MKPEIKKKIITTTVCQYYLFCYMYSEYDRQNIYLSTSISTIKLTTARSFTIGTYHYSELYLFIGIFSEPSKHNFTISVHGYLIPQKFINYSYQKTCFKKITLVQQACVNRTLLFLAFKCLRTHTHTRVTFQLFATMPRVLQFSSTNYLAPASRRLIVPRLTFQTKPDAVSWFMQSCFFFISLKKNRQTWWSWQ